MGERRGSEARTQKRESSPNPCTPLWEVWGAYGKTDGGSFWEKRRGDACMECGGMLDRFPPSFFPLYSLRGFWPLFSADPCAQQAREWKWKQ